MVLALFFATIATTQAKTRVLSIQCSKYDAALNYTLFYDQFLKNSRNMKQAYTYVYQRIDNILEQEVKNNCPTNPTVSERKEFALSKYELCVESCADVSEDFHTNVITTNFLRNIKIKTLKRECSNLCVKVYNFEKDGKAYPKASNFQF
jgi:hypothetical protein